MNDITYKQFGRYLLDTLDLDPLYVILRQSSMNERQMKRWLLGYWIFYAAGPASVLSEEPQPKRYYERMLRGNDNHWPRGHERRHMRGEAFNKTVLGLMEHGAPEFVVDKMVSQRNFADHTRVMSQFWGFGPWISFKIYDMMERVLGIPTDIENVDLYIYRDPVKGAALYEFGDQNAPITRDELWEVICELLQVFRGYKAPPFMDRYLSPMEIETILCKAKSNVNGHYPLANDVFDIYHGLHNAPHSDTGFELRGLMSVLVQPWKHWTDEERNVRIAI